MDNYVKLYDLDFNFLDKLNLYSELYTLGLSWFWYAYYVFILLSICVSQSKSFCKMKKEIGER